MATFFHLFRQVWSVDIWNFRFCSLPPFNGKCAIPEQQMGPGSITIGEKRSSNVGRNRIALREATAKVDTNKVRNNEVQICSQDEDVKVTTNLRVIGMSCFLNANSWEVDNLIVLFVQNVKLINKRKNPSNSQDNIEGMCVVWIKQKHWKVTNKNRENL